MSEMEPSRMPKKRMPSTNTRMVTTVSGTVWGVMSPYPTVTTYRPGTCLPGGADKSPGGAHKSSWLMFLNPMVTAYSPGMCLPGGAGCSLARLLVWEMLLLLASSSGVGHHACRDVVGFRCHHGLLMTSAGATCGRAILIFTDMFSDIKARNG